MKNVKIKFDMRDHHAQGFLKNILSDLCVFEEVQDEAFLKRVINA